MADETRARCFCLRRVNPFQGVVAVVKTSGGRAISLDGRSWQVQVLAHPPRGLWSQGGHGDALEYFRFGVWSREAGLSRVPLNPILDQGRMLAESQALIAAVREHAERLPFPLEPELEHWLLDTEGQPLALIGTALHERDLHVMQSRGWRAGGRGDERPFVAPSLAERGIPQRDDSGRRFHVDAIEDLIGQAAGPQPATQWFRVDGDVARGLEIAAPEALAGRTLTLGDFPPLTLRTDWPEPGDALLARDYVEWLAPFLLALASLDDALRARLEPAAARHALLVDALWRLYPRVLAPGLLNRARVEARLRRADTAA